MPFKPVGAKAHKYFVKWTSKNLCDTIVYSSYPIAKLSIKKRIYTSEGKLYLLNSVDNNIIVFDLFEDKVLDTISIPEIAKRNAYFKFGRKTDRNDYYFYKKLIINHIQEPLCTIKDISIYKDTLYLYIQNYFVYWGGAQSKDTFLTHFQSISKFHNGKYVATSVPTDIIERLVDTSIPFFAEESIFYKYKKNIYLTLWNSKYYKGKDKYLVGYFNKNKKLDWIIKLNGIDSKSYNYTNPIFYKNYCMIGKSTKLYNLNHRGSFVDLNYFKQKYDGSRLYIPKYVNFDFSIINNTCTVLYNEETNNKPYYAKINLNNNHLIMNKYLPQLNPKLVRTLSPFNSNYIIQYANNNNIIKYNIYK